jgi:hypothetical protein
LETARLEEFRMTTHSLSLEERLTAHPQLKERIEALLAIVEDTKADVKQADEAERRVIAELRRVGNEALCSWAAQQEAAQRAVVGQPGAARAGKKTLLVYHVWGNKRGRAPLLAGGPRGPAVLPCGGGPMSGLFPALTAADDGFWGGYGVWTSLRQTQGALWD